MRYGLILFLAVFLNGCTAPLALWAYKKGKADGKAEAQQAKAQTEGVEVDDQDGQ